MSINSPFAIQTNSGHYFDFASPTAESIQIRDIAVGLSRLCRFTGHCKQFYSVAQHSVLVSKLVHPRLAMLGLLHDASEAYMGDVNKPLKMMLPDYRHIEERVQEAILIKYNLNALNAVSHQAIKRADIEMLFHEKVALMPGSPWEWEWPDFITKGELIPMEISPLNEHMACDLFLDRYLDLLGIK